MRIRTLAGTALVLLSLPGAAAAQAAWDTPSFLPPAPGDDIGAYYVQPDASDWGVVGIWRQQGNLNLGARLGVVQPSFGGADLMWMAGGESWGTLLAAGAQLPVNVAWTLGFGASFGNGVTFARVPVGVSIGRWLDLGGLAIQPYAHPRLGLDIYAPDEGDSETELAFLADLGVDLALGSALTVRAGISLGDADAVGVGVAYRMQRRVEVR
ncbi:MAG TPA: hypothetical protein VMK65_13850 [Longimicrobiales bacterium]|nr:hypothetical protein [Longimicrobiales bacterium]